MNTEVTLSPEERPGQSTITVESDPTRWFGMRSSFGAVLWVSAFRSQRFPTNVKLIAVGGRLAFPGEPEGLAIPMQPLSMHQLQIQVPISDEQITRLEYKRAGQPAVFDLVLRGIGFADPSSTASPSTFTSQFNPPITISRDEWCKILAGLGAGTRRVIELPPAPRDVGGLWNAAAERLDAAASRLASGEARIALAEARIAMERSLEALASAWGAPRGKEAFRPFVDRIAAENRRRREDRDDPYAAIARAIELGADLFGFASEPGHNSFENTERLNAELAVTLVTAIYTYFARLPRMASVDVVAG